SFLSHYDALLLYLHSFPTRRSSDLKDTLKGILDKSSHSIDYFFNKRGTKFKELGLKERLHDLSEEEKLELLASDGMLIKRPMVRSEEHTSELQSRFDIVCRLLLEKK